MEVKIMSRKFIKPSRPTPDNLRNMNISFIDQLAPAVYVPVILYYPTANANFQLEEKCRLLETSLSETLTYFYPLAGRYIPDMNLVECNDSGALYIETEVNCNMDQIVEADPDAMVLNSLVPLEEVSRSSVTLIIQINKFECGGLAICASVLHKVADGVSLSSFVNAWSTICNSAIEEAIRPNFDSRLLFQARDYSIGLSTPVPVDGGRKIITKRFVFSGEAISSLKEKVLAYKIDASDVKNKPTRVQVVTGLIWQVLISISQKKHATTRPSSLVISMNLRGKTKIPIPENSCGNFYRMVVSKLNESESNIELHALVNLLGSSINRAMKECEEAEDTNELVEMVSDSFKRVEEEIVEKGKVGGVCVFSSWCRFGFYGNDFSWGKPSWVSSVHMPVPIIILMDTKCGRGIEARVSLEEETMIQFEQDKEIVAFTSSFLK